ncbi:hypothetical protein C1I63_13830 [Rathayibacter caricis DSM 15933]|uniref:Uncharacterized protein n=1 Tax=Rathayibacter caricis DSM 15933 TaxID=1328867 RepID=A0A2T4UWA1_9MICO|nr:hypothetical protein [Rathayibacter caricis]PTL73809.1 hypothetical protein C1I63_13830 [Rathayibacter caricis DSM 15933]
MSSIDTILTGNPTGEYAAYLPTVDIPALATGYVARYRAADIDAPIGSIVTPWNNAVTGGTNLTGTNGFTLRVDADGYKYLESDGVNDALLYSGGIGTALTASYVLAIPSLPSGKRILHGSTIYTNNVAGSPRQELAVNAQGYWTANSGTEVGTVRATTERTVLTAVYAPGAPSSLAVNANPEDIGANNANSGGVNFLFALQGGVYTRIRWYELVLYTSALTAPARTENQDALMSAYAIA